MLKSGFTGLRCLHFGEEAAVELPIDDIDKSLEEFTDLDLSFMSDRHSKELDIDVVDSYTTVEWFQAYATWVFDFPWAWVGLNITNYEQE